MLHHTSYCLNKKTNFNLSIYLIRLNNSDLDDRCGRGRELASVHFNLMFYNCSTLKLENKF